MIVYKVWCEWDIGLEGVMFASEEAARRDVKAALKDSDVEESLQELEDEGLVSFEAMRVIE